MTLTHVSTTEVETSSEMAITLHVHARKITRRRGRLPSLAELKAKLNGSPESIAKAEANAMKLIGRPRL